MSFGTITAPLVPLISLSQLFMSIFDAVMHYGAFMLFYAIGAFIK